MLINQPYYIGGKTMEKKIVFAEGAPAPVGPYNHGVIFNNVLYTCGQLGLDPATGNLVDTSLEDEVRQAMKNMEAVLAAAGAGYDDMLNCKLTISDMNNFGAINKIYGEFVKEDTAPGRSCVQVAMLPKNANFQIEVIAAV